MTGSETESRLRLAQTFRQAEQDGLRIAIKGRLVALLLVGAFLVISRVGNPESALGYFVVFSGFALLGVVQYYLIGSDYDRAWMKYVFVTIDIAVISMLMATQPLYETIDLPQAIVYKNPIFPFYFVILAAAAFSFSPGLVLWAGGAGVVGWMGSFSWSVRDLPGRLSWTDIPAEPTTQEFIAIFYNPLFLPTGSRVQESIALFVVAILIAAVMWRARRTVYLQLQGEEERREITNIFGQYVPKQVADALISDRGLLQPVERTVSVLFIDIAGFTQLMESNGPQHIVTILSEYFDAATGIISAHQGVVTQFHGDAIMATFNAPVADSNHAQHAVLAAQEIIKLVANQRFGQHKLAVRAGISTGTVMAGSVGGGGRQNYTIYGDTVNLAARLEALNKEHGTHILLAASTAAQLTDFALREIGQLSVRGLSKPVAVFTPQAQAAR